MDTYNLKDKIQVTSEFLSNLEAKSWQEIEHLQAQIANIEVDQKSAPLINLLKNLLTSYYVFAGGLENLSSEPIPTDIAYAEKPEEKVLPLADVKLETPIEDPPIEDPIRDLSDDNIVTDTFEPFEFFVDFDEPSGEPLSDEDLYGKK